MATMASCLDQVSTTRSQFSICTTLRQSLRNATCPSRGCAAGASCRGLSAVRCNDRGLPAFSNSNKGFRSPSSIGFGAQLGSRLCSVGGGLGSGCSTTRSRRTRVSIVAQARKDSIEAPERILAALGYVLPFFDGIQYGRYFFLQYPVAEALLRPLYPLLAAYKGFPYSNFIAFFSLYLLVVRNQSISRYVRFNAMQAVVLDVLLILPTLIERNFAPRGGVGFQLLIIFYNTIFLFLVACFLFGVLSCLLGKTPRLPIVADAADAQV